MTDPWREYRFVQSWRCWLALCLLAAIAWMWMVVAVGCASPKALTMVPSPPATQPADADQTIAAATSGQIAATVAAQVKSEVFAELTGIEYNRTVDHALDGGQLLVLLTVVWCSHKREKLRIERNGACGK